MKSNQDLFYLTAILLDKMRGVYIDVKPDLVIVQGDTTTAFAATLRLFILKYLLRMLRLDFGPMTSMRHSLRK